MTTGCLKWCFNEVATLRTKQFACGSKHMLLIGPHEGFPTVTSQETLKPLIRPHDKKKIMNCKFDFILGKKELE